MIVKVNYTAVGLFVLILSVAFITGILWLTTGGPRQAYDTYVVYMTESVSGLSRDGAVKYRGVDVGKIAELALDQGNPERVRILLSIKRGVPIKADTSATIAEQGLTGLAHINLTGGSRDAPPLQARAGERYPVIASKPSRLEEFGTRFSNLLTVMTDTSAQLNMLLSETNRNKIAGILANLETLTDTLAAQSTTLTATLNNFSQTAKNIHTASTRLPASIEQLQQSALSLQKMADEITLAGSSINTTIHANSRQFEQFAQETLPEISLLVQELHQAAENLRHMSEQLETDPSVLLYGTPARAPGPGE